mgnify:CR=1 FL=1
MVAQAGEKVLRLEREWPYRLAGGLVIFGTIALLAGIILTLKNDLVNKRVEVVFADGVTVTDGFLKKPTGKGFAQVGEDVSSSADKAILGDGTGFAVRKEDTELLANLNKAFDAIRANGKYKAIADKYFNFDIYGQ